MNWQSVLCQMKLLGIQVSCAPPQNLQLRSQQDKLTKLFWTTSAANIHCHLSGIWAAGAFSKARKEVQKGAAAEQMLAVERQMQDLLTRMQGVNQSIAAQHLEATSSSGMYLFLRPANAGFGPNASRQPAEWPAKLDFSFLNQKVR